MNVFQAIVKLFPHLIVNELNLLVYVINFNKTHHGC